LDSNQTAETEECEEKQLALGGIANPILQKLAGVQGAACGPKVEPEEID
jgi:hypothetical protein